LLVSVIVPVRNGGLHLTRCLAALQASAHANFEVIVVDDCSTDQTPVIAERCEARYLRTPHPMGPAGARNLGASCARGEILLFVDADVVLPPQALSMIVEEFERDAQIAAVFGSYDRKPVWSNFWSQYKNLMHHYVHQISQERAISFWAGCGAMRKKVFEEMGGFDAQKYAKPTIEDIELGFKVAKAGYRIRLNKELQVKHLKKWTLWSLLRADVFYRAVPWTWLILESGQLPRDLNLGYASRVSAALVGLAVFLGGFFSLEIALRVRWVSLLPLVALIASVFVSLLVLNWRVYVFFAQLRGWRFALKAVLAHWLYYFYSGVVFLVCSSLHFVGYGAAPLRAPVQGQRSLE
jgi:glycosyltransferase involved in cell wall biosynthesis